MGTRPRSDLERNTALLASVVDSGPDGVFVVDGEGRVVLANRTAHGIFGCTPEEFMGLDVDSLVPIELFTTPGDRKRFSEHVRPLVESTAPVATFAARMIRKDGRTVEVESAVTVLEVQGDDAVFVLVSRDVTERNGAERELVSQRDHDAHLLGLLDEA